MLPKLDGLEVCKRLRAESTVPIIMLTARDDELDKVLGLELGADDYITKPFLIREFRSRVRAVLRRAATPHLGGKREETIDRGDVRIDLPRRTVEVRGAPVQLTFVEFELLALLAANPGVVYSRRQLLERLRGGADYREPRTIDVHVRHLQGEDRAGVRRARADPDGSRRRVPLPRRMSIPGGIRVKLALALLGIVGGALLAAYVIVVPSLERRLVNAKLDQLQSDAEALAVNYAGLDAINRQRLDDFVDASAFVSNARVVVFAVTDPPRNQVLRSLADSSAVGGSRSRRIRPPSQAAQGA